MRPPGIAMQLDELEYLLPGLYPGVALAIEGELPFQGLKERLHDGVAARTALAGERLDEPAILELPAKPARGGWPGRATLPSWGCGRCRRTTRCSSF